MKLRIKTIVLTLLAIGTLSLATGCAAEQTPYEKNNAENYSVSVKFDANGGNFTTNTSVIVDSFNIEDMKTNSEGKVELALLSPDNTLRGNDAFTATKNGCFLAGWYAQRTETGKDDEGNPVYTYGEKWDFEKSLLPVDPKGEYTSEEPVLTLYAAWVPMFEIEFYSLDTGDYLNSYVYNPTTAGDIKVPVWDEETGAIEMYDFPEREGYTFNGVYFDAEGKSKVDTDVITHTGTVDIATAVAKDSKMKLYVDWVEGEWYHIYNVEQFVDNANLNGSYELHADLDFTDVIWPTAFMYGNFAGTIKGNGHTIKNVEVVQTNNSKVNAGLFGNLTEKTNISDVTFENITVTIQSGTRVAGTSYGLFAGTIAENAVLNNVKLLSSTLKIDSKCYFGVTDYVIGLVCGMGNPDVIADAQVACVATGENPDNVKITVNGNEVTVEIITQ